ncbi:MULTISPECIES: SH3 domain-containing protein [Leptolyngbya]|uniref:SH3 domain-containing protein n=1 Tax=Leptolyngbya TaxID=47251 RepID=UPI00168224DD|nr:SH3 domain-containing protein [Leptolyngbya sp. FACHB-1624]MBD1859955.1 SH3 domain-containing protein [Leptolyngbya sp. FACHB-1624]
MQLSISFLAGLLLLAACSAPPQNTALPSASETTAPSPSETPSSLPTPVTLSPTPSIEKPSPTVPSLSDRQVTLTAQDPNAQINVREDASTRSTAQHYGVVGDVVQVLSEKQGDDGQTWYQVKFPSGATGWVNGQFVAIAGKSSTESSPAVSPSPTSEGLNPIREPVSGSCECPYDTDKRGRSCGRRSAYSRPGGSAPACYK